jgi:hypothetical protein
MRLARAQLLAPADLHRRGKKNVGLGEPVAADEPRVLSARRGAFAVVGGAELKQFDQTYRARQGRGGPSLTP